MCDGSFSQQTSKHEDEGGGGLDQHIGLMGGVFTGGVQGSGVYTGVLRQLFKDKSSLLRLQSLIGCFLSSHLVGRGEKTSG